MRHAVTDRLALIVSGPVGRAVAFAGDFFAALWRAALGDPRHPEERRVPPPGS